MDTLKDLKTFGPLGLLIYLFFWLCTRALLPLPLGLENLFLWFVAPIGGLAGYGLAIIWRSRLEQSSSTKTFLYAVAAVVCGVVLALTYIKTYYASGQDPGVLYIFIEGLLLALTFLSFGYVIGAVRLRLPQK